MSFQRGVLIGFALLAFGSLSWASASDPAIKKGIISANKPSISKVSKINDALSITSNKKTITQNSLTNQDLQAGLALVAPPAELPRAVGTIADDKINLSDQKSAPRASKEIFSYKSPKTLVVSNSSNNVNGANQVMNSVGKVKDAKNGNNINTAGDLQIVPPPNEISSNHKIANSSVNTGPLHQKVQFQNASAPATKPKKLFSYVRLLNYAPHPTTEEFLKNQPIVRNGHRYWFSIKYLEGWKALNDDEGILQNIGFEISLMDGNQKIRTLRTPKIDINPATLVKGQILGIAEVLPYRFYITVDQFTPKKKGISELIFKLDLLG